VKGASPPVRRAAMAAVLGLILLSVTLGARGDEVLALTTANFSQHLKDNKQTMVEFYAPWCSHCKKLTPEYEKAAGNLKALGKAVSLVKVDATEEKDLATKYGVKGFPFLTWFEDGKETEYDGGRTAETMVEWVLSMMGPAILTVEEGRQVPDPPADKPRVVLYFSALAPGYEEVAKASRRKADFYFVKSTLSSKISITHRGESAWETAHTRFDKEFVEKFLGDNLMPVFGKLDGETFDKYMEAGKGIVWALFPPGQDGPDAIVSTYGQMMREVATSIRGKYFVAWTDTEQFREAIENMLSVTEYPAIAVQKKAGDKKKYVWEGDMTASSIKRFIDEVEAGRVNPKLKSEPDVRSYDGETRIIVGSTMRQAFSPDKDVLLEVYAPWCGHCKKLEPEYIKLAAKVKKEGLTDLLTIAKMDGTANDSPIESMDWTGFPTIFFIKAGSSPDTSVPIVYEGERTAKGLWKFIKKTATKADEIRERLERQKGSKKRGDEL